MRLSSNFKFGKPSYGKYKNKTSEFAGRSFASKLEASVYGLLLQMQRGGLITGLECQRSVYLTDARIQMIPDFEFLDCETGLVTYAEAKGFETSDYRIKRRLWKFYGPGTLWVYKGTAKNPKLFETIVPTTAKFKGD